MSDFSFSLQRLLNTPLLATERHAAMVVAAVRSQLGFHSLRMPDDNSGDVTLSEGDLDMLALSGRETAVTTNKSRRARRKIYEEAGYIAIVPVWGTLTKATGSMDPSSGMTGYNRIEQKMAEAQQDPDIRGIWLDHDSGGGEAGNMLGLANFIYRSSARFGGKPVWAMASAYSYSASFGVMCGADRVICTPDGGVGSVGTLMLYANQSKFYKAKGIDVRVLKSGSKKARLNPFEEPDDETLAHYQEQLDHLRDLFSASVALHRGKAIHADPDKAKKKVLETEGEDYRAELARAIGFVDAVMTEQEAFASFVQFLSR